MSQVVCYVERFASGAALKGLRLVARRSVRDWRAPGTPKTGQAALETAKSAARWIGENADAGKPLVVCLDLDASVCSWLSAPSPELKVVRAAAQAIAAGGRGDEQTGPSSTWLSLGELGIEESVQGLHEGGPVTGRLKGSATHSQRMGVLAVSDLGARNLLDALDAEGRSPVRVISLWHAMAEAWGRADAAQSAREAVAETEPTSAVVTIDPEGRLAWCWSRGGHVLCAGTMLLKHVVSTPEPDAGVTGEFGVIEMSRSDVGRLISDWLAWSVELGFGPARLVCLAPPSLTVVGLDADLPERSGAAAVGETLGAAWPGSVVASEVLDDPVGATLQRLVDQSDDVPAGGELEELSSRPGRTSRRMYHWIALAVTAGAVVVGAIGYRLSGSAAAIEGELETIADERKALLDRLKTFSPRMVTEADPVALIRAERNKLATAMRAVQPENPAVREMARLIQTVSAVGGVTITDLKVYSNRPAQVMFEAPDSQTWSKVVAAVQASANVPPPRLDWTQEVRPGAGGKTLYILRGAWVTPTATPGGGGGNP